MVKPRVSVETATEHLAATEDPIHRWIDPKGLPAYRIGRPWKSEFNDFDERVSARGAHNMPAVATVGGKPKG